MTLRSWLRFALLPIFFLPACATISPFNQVAYERATSLKVEALDVMDKATEPYQDHKTEVARLTLETKKAYEYAKGRPYNDFTSKQWAILIDPERNLLGGFFKYWKDRSVVSKPFIDGAETNVGQAFNEIIALESGKSKLPDGKSQ